MSPFPSSLIRAPLPGECVYSIAANLACDWAFQVPEAAKAFLRSPKIARDYVGQLNDIAQAFDPSLAITGRHLALRHTALPLQLAFVDQARRECLIQRALNGSVLQLELGIAPSGIETVRALRFCPLCMDADRQRYGRAFWHVAHQISGVHVCSAHETPLLAASATDLRGGAARYITAEIAANEESVPLAQATTGPLLGIARDADWLLKNDDIPAPGPQKLHAHHRALAIANGYSTSNGAVAITALATDLIAHYGRSFFDALAPGRDGAAWVAQLVRPPRAHQQPIRHLLLSRFFGLTIEQFLDGGNRAMASRSTPREHKHRIKDQGRLARLLIEKRAQWTAACEVEQRSAREANEPLYAWLWRNDRLWLRSHRRRAVARKPNFELWAKRDAELAEQVAQLASATKATNGPRVSRCYLARRSGRYGWLVRDHPHLPKTNAAIRSCCESAVDHAIRRISMHCAAGNDTTAVWRVREACGISSSLAETPVIATALAAAVGIKACHE